MRVAIYFPSYGDGGAERMLVNLAAGLGDTGVAVDFIARKGSSPHLATLEGRAETFLFGSERPARFLKRYLLEHAPDAVIAAKDHALEELLRVRRRGRWRFAVVARPGTNITRRLERRGWLQRWRTRRRLRACYRQADLVVANSRGVAEDIARITGLDIAAIPVVRNPVVTPELPRLAAGACTHPWLRDKDGGPVIVGMGGLRHQKGFDVLLKAFAEVCRQADARLVILGRGHLRESLLGLAGRLGIARRVDLPGFVENPYPCLARADLFVLSSNWEGSPNALTEALALGVPVVATDCPSGPREILQDGRVGTLVAPGAPEKMAQAILAALAATADRALLRASVAGYSRESAAEQYRLLLRALQEKARG